MLMQESANSSNKKNYNQKFRVEWVNDPELKCMKEIENPYKCLCSACNVTLYCGKSELIKHVKTSKHRKNLEISKTNVNIATLLTSSNRNGFLDENIKSAEIKLSCFYAEHNIAVEHMVPLLKSIAPDSKILQGIQLGRTKCTKIIQNVICKKATTDITEVLKTQKFSILIDESTDISVKKLFATLVRYWDNKNNISVTNLLELITIDGRDGTSEKLFNIFEECLKKYNIPIKNIIGMASDNANVMVGYFNSFKTRLQQATDVLVVIPCVCHSSAIVASKACENLPKTPEEFLRSISAYFSHSSKRVSELHDFQEFFHVQTKKILHLSGTRWLSMHQCISRIIENWDVLSQYFTLAAFEEKSKQCDFILEQLKQNKCTKAYLLFLKYALNFLNNFNGLFQSRKLLIHELMQEFKRLLRQFLVNFVKPEVLKQFDVNFNYSHSSNYIEFNSIELGIECTNFIKHMPAEVISDIRKRCLNFYVTASEELRKRFPSDVEFFESLSFIKPELALNIKKPIFLVNLHSILKYFAKVIDIDLVQVEWKRIAVYYSEEEKICIKLLDPQEFWTKLSETKDYNDTNIFGNISNLAKMVMVLPHSNAETERIFSIVNDCKSKKRNKLSGTSLNAVAVIRHHLSIENRNCSTFDVDRKHIDLMTKNNLYA